MLLPMLLLLSMLVVQAALWFHSSALARTAANKGVDAARVEQGTAADGREMAEQFLADTAVLRNPQVQVARTDGTATATVSGDVASLVFGLPLTVTITVEAPVERMPT